MRRSMLFIPGNSAAMLLNAGQLGADAVILDLEDAVSPTEKDSARILIRNTLGSSVIQNTEIIIRINQLDGNFWQEDLDQILPQEPEAILLPKTNRPEDIHTLALYMAEVEARHKIAKPVRIIALIETATGVENAYAIASADPRMTALFLGAEDLTADLRSQRTKDGTEILYSRGRVVNAARAAGIDCYDTPFTDTNDEEGVVSDAQFAKQLGFTGKAAISPRHVLAINEVFSPSLAEIHYAQEVMAAIREGQRLGKGAVSLYGKMIDAPIVARAQQTLAMAEALGRFLNE